MRNLYFVILALLIGCAKPFLKDDNMLTITAFSTSFDTKATETAFLAGDEIGVFIENNTPNLRYETTDGSTWRGFGNLTEFKTGDNAIAYYPYSQTATNMNAIEISSGVDFMVCPKTPLTIADNKASAALNFKHVLSKLVVSMEIPSEINGLETASLESITVKNVFRKGVIDITTKAITGLTDVGDVVLTSGEAIIIPQTISRIEFSFKMEGGGSATLAHTKPITLTPGTKTTLQAISNADLYFSSSLDLKHGDAQANLPLSIFAASGRTWTLVSSAPAWLTVAPAGGTGAATVKVSVTANTASPYAPRTALLTLEDNKGALAYLSVMQNYSKFELAMGDWVSIAASGQVAAVNGFSSNRVWQAKVEAGFNSWLKLSTSAAAGVALVDSYNGIGTLAANTLYMQTVAANAATTVRSGKVGFYCGELLMKQITASQAVAYLNISAASASVGVDVASSNFTLNANVPYSSAYSAGGGSAQGVGNTPPYANAGVTFNYPAQPAAPSAARNHVMTVTPNPANGAGAVARTFTVTQAARPVSFSMSPLAPGVVVPKTGGTYYATVTTNASWSVTSSSNVTTSISGATLTITVGANSVSSTRSLSATVTTSNTAGQNNLSATWSGTQADAFDPNTPVTINNVKWMPTNLTASYQGQVSGFTVAVSPSDWGVFFKWGSKYAYTHPGANAPSGHWGAGGVEMSATSPSSGSGTGYDYVGLGGGAAPGDPCAQLGAYRTPTHAQWQALNNSGTKWGTYKGISGRFFGPSYSSCGNDIIASGCIFLPAAGARSCNDGSLGDESSAGDYWSSSVRNSYGGWNYRFYISGGSTDNVNYGRGNGFSVRCVQQ